MVLIHCHFQIPPWPRLLEMVQLWIFTYEDDTVMTHNMTQPVFDSAQGNWRARSVTS